MVGVLADLGGGGVAGREDDEKEGDNCQGIASWRVASSPRDFSLLVNLTESVVSASLYLLP